MKSVLPDIPRPLVFGHRGMPADYPENTMISFRAACAAGVPGIELDVHLTADRRLAVIHDDSTERTCRDSRGAAVSLAIEQTDWMQLSSLSAGVWKGSAFTGEKIPLLDEVLEALGKDCYFDIELKTRSTSDAGLEQLTARTIRAFGLQNRCIVSSFNPFPLRIFKKYAPEIPTAIIWSRSRELYWFLRHGEGYFLAHADILKPEHMLVQQDAWFMKLGKPVIPWAVDERETADRLLAAGCEGLISNQPRILLGRGEVFGRFRRPAAKP